MNTAAKKLELEHQINKLNRDYRNLRQAIYSTDPDSHVRAFLEKLGHTVTETKRILLELSKE